MKINQSFALAFLAVPLFANPLAEELTFTPEEGSEVRITFDQVSMLELTDTESVLTVNGEEQETGDMPDIQIVRKFVEHIRYTDEFLGVEDGRPVKVRRSYEEIGVSSNENVVDPEGEELENSYEEGSALLGTTVLFVWDEDSDDYGKSFVDDDETDEDLLEKLNVNGYLAEFLPDGEVAEGEDWEIDAEAFYVLIYPGGDLSYEVVDAEDAGEEDESQEVFEEQYRDNMEGEILGEYQGTRDEDDVEVAVIALTLEISTSVEQEGEMTVQMGEEETDGTTSKAFEFTFDLEGELLWNVKAGRAHSLVLQGDKTFTLEEGQAFEAPGAAVEFSSTQSFEGTLELRYNFE